MSSVVALNSLSTFLIITPLVLSALDAAYMYNQLSGDDRQDVNLSNLLWVQGITTGFMTLFVFYSAFTGVTYKVLVLVILYLLFTSACTYAFYAIKKTSNETDTSKAYRKIALWGQIILFLIGGGVALWKIPPEYKHVNIKFPHISFKKA
jgi:4-hydroxybenzoate polyprenyltransferase